MTAGSVPVNITLTPPFANISEPVTFDIPSSLQQVLAHIPSFQQATAQTTELHEGVQLSLTVRQVTTTRTIVQTPFMIYKPGQSRLCELNGCCRPFSVRAG